MRWKIQPTQFVSDLTYTGITSMNTIESFKLY